MTTMPSKRRNWMPLLILSGLVSAVEVCFFASNALPGVLIYRIILLVLAVVLAVAFFQASRRFDGFKRLIGLAINPIFAWTFGYASVTSFMQLDLNYWNIYREPMFLPFAVVGMTLSAAPALLGMSLAELKSGEVQEANTG